MEGKESTTRSISRRESMENLPSTSAMEKISLERCPTPRTDVVETDPMPCTQREPMLIIEPRAASPTNNLQVYKYRFVILLIYSLYSGANLYQLNQYTIVETVMKKFFETNAFMVGLCQIVYLVVMAFLLIPIVRIVEGFDMKITGFIVSACTFVGSAFRVVATEPEKMDFKVILTAQCVCGFAQIFSMVVPAKVVSIWFPAEELNRASAVALFGGEIGMMLGAIYPLHFVEDIKNNKELRQTIYQQLLFNFVVCVIAFLLVILFFKSKPRTPPSAQRCHVADTRTIYFTSFMDLAVNCDFLILVVLNALSCGLWIVFGVNRKFIYLHYFPDFPNDLIPIIVITSIVGGLIGNYLFGYILDKTHKYKLLTFIIFLSMTLSYVALIVCLEMKWHWPSFVTIILFGFFGSSCLNLSYQFIAEVTFPISEVIPIAILHIMMFTVTIVFQVIFSTLIEFNQIHLLHTSAVITLCGITIGTYFLTSNLKRMIFKARQE